MKSLVPLLAAAFGVASCAGMQRALDAGGQHGTQLAAGTFIGGLLWLLHPVGWLGATIAAMGGAVGSLLFTPGVAASGGQPQAGGPSAFVWIVVGAGLALALRSWGHWLPAVIRRLAPAVKTTARAVLGGVSKKLK